MAEMYLISGKEYEDFTYKKYDNIHHAYNVDHLIITKK
jgi:hypothetical protein